MTPEERRAIKALHLHRRRRLSPEAQTVPFQDFTQPHPMRGQWVIELNEVPGHPGLSVIRTMIKGDMRVFYAHTSDLTKKE